MQCTATYRALDAAGIEFNVIDITEDADAMEYVTGDLGYAQAPVIVDEGDGVNHWSGYRPDKIGQLNNE